MLSLSGKSGCLRTYLSLRALSNLKSEKDKGGSKLHALYEQYLACQGNWRDCVLLIEVSKRNRLKQDEIYTWLRFAVF